MYGIAYMPENSDMNERRFYMKNTVRTLIHCCIIMFSVFLIIHRRVISALITGEPMPEPPEWHKKFLGCGSDNEKCCE